MKANELRIGNWMKDDESKKTGQVTAISDMVIESTGGFDASFGEPIPLTPEWLERFGFKSIGGYVGTSSERYERDGFYWTIQQDSIFYLEEPDTGRCVSHFHNVHQLQNLYFALTGEELTLNN